MSAAVLERFDVAALLARLKAAPRRITTDSRDVRAGDAFVAFPGARVDGRAYIGEALARGAGAALWEASGFAWNSAWSVPNVPVDGLRDKLGAIADFIYGSPSRALWMVGVTGTNGKTSCAHWIAQCLERSGRRSAVLGTLGNGLVGELTPASHTTVDAAVLHETLAALRAAGAETATLEVSSHGLDQGRVNGVAFDIALFTNLSRDHLDYHGTMALYGAAKARLFSWPGLHASVVNVDDPFGRSLADAAKARGQRVLTYGFGGADIAASNLLATPSGMTFNVITPWGRAAIVTELVGEFNAWNLLGVLGVLLASEVGLETAVSALAKLEAPPGRMQRIGGDGVPVVVVDYAHSPDALEKVLSALRPVVGGEGALVCVFGCGGNRDAGKRPEMGRIAGALADRVLITDDNPRHEDPGVIAEAILHGLQETPNRRWAIDHDRAAAIASAVRGARPGDVVLVAGKGHEDYQERNGVRQPFSDIEVAQAALAAWMPA